MTIISAFIAFTIRRRSSPLDRLIAGSARSEPRTRKLKLRPDLSVVLSRFESMIAQTRTGFAPDLPGSIRGFPRNRN